MRVRNITDQPVPVSDGPPVEPLAFRDNVDPTKDPVAAIALEQGQLVEAPETSAPAPEPEPAPRRRRTTTPEEPSA